MMFNEKLRNNFICKWVIIINVNLVCINNYYEREKKPSVQPSL